MKCDFEIVAAANQTHKVDERANGSSRRGHERRGQDLDRASLGVKMLVRAFKRSGCGGGIFSCEDIRQIRCGSQVMRLTNLQHLHQQHRERQS